VAYRFGPPCILSQHWVLYTAADYRKWSPYSDVKNTT